ncbi:MAG: HAMP domain-containing sensor histidine kinase [Bacteroidota bacterium]
MLKISTRITLWYLIASGLIMLMMGIAMYSIFDATRRAAIDSDLYEYADFLTSGLGEQSKDMTELFEELIAKKEIPLAKPRAHKFVLASTDSLIFEKNTLINIDSLLDVMQDRKEADQDSAYITIELNNVDYRIYIRPIKLTKKKGFQLIVITSMDRHYESLAQLRYILLIISSVALIVFGIIGFFLAKRALAPVSNITKTAASISSESLDKRVPIGKSQDELSNLAATFNDMISRLDNTFQSHQRFIADASHDFRTPLTVIQVELEMLLSKKILDENSVVIVENCLKEIQRLSKLSDNLLILARSDAKYLVLNKKKFRLDELIMECVSQLNLIAQAKNITFRFLSTEPTEIVADRELLARVFTNVIDNALKYSFENEVVRITIDQSLNNAIVEVQNKGNPIPSELLPVIFNRFHRGEKSRTSSGFGLGLSIVKALVESHKGIVAIESNKENGTTVRISLPM